MKHSRFEALIIALGAIVIITPVLLGPPLNPQWQELVAQGLLVVVLASAVHWGRDGGSLAAAAAMFAYVVIRVPLLSTEGLTSNTVGMILTRMITFSLVGVLGGELFARLKYLLARLEGSAMLDHVTNVYNRRYCARAIGDGIGGFQRYQTPFSVALVSLSPGLLNDLHTARQNTMLRTVASRIRNDVRLVDDIGYLGDGRFMLLFPHTDKSGARAASDRVCATVREALGARDQSVVTVTLGCPEDIDALCELARSLDPEVDLPLDAGVDDVGQRS
ncbi:MAG: diguanylate cyclase [Actinomycetia bacterium]|nr:diguanylate cyclase [Actinomycetes bacterium]